MATAGEFIMRCFEARTAAHVMHLKTTSYAQHKALQEFYESVIPIVDRFAETYQGEYGLIEDYPAVKKQHDDPVKMMSDLGKWIEEGRDEISDDTCCQNIIDEVLAVVYSTLYKLKFLK